MARKRSAAVRLTITAMLAASLTACSSGDEPDPENAAICVDPNTQVRVDDSQCGDDYDHHIYSNGGGFGTAALWYFIGRGSAYPPMGARYGGGTFTRPANISGIGRGASRTGGTVARGGFGGSAKSGSS